MCHCVIVLLPCVCHLMLFDSCHLMPSEGRGTVDQLAKCLRRRQSLHARCEAGIGDCLWHCGTWCHVTGLHLVLCQDWQRHFQKHSIQNTCQLSMPMWRHQFCPRSGVVEAFQARPLKRARPSRPPPPPPGPPPWWVPGKSHQPTPPWRGGGAEAPPLPTLCEAPPSASMSQPCDSMAGGYASGSMAPGPSNVTSDSMAPGPSHLTSGTQEHRGTVRAPATDASSSSTGSSWPGSRRQVAAGWEDPSQQDDWGQLRRAPVLLLDWFNCLCVFCCIKVNLRNDKCLIVIDMMYDVCIISFLFDICSGLRSLRTIMCHHQWASNCWHCRSQMHWRFCHLASVIDLWWLCVVCAFVYVMDCAHAFICLWSQVTHAFQEVPWWPWLLWWLAAQSNQYLGSVVGSVCAHAVNEMCVHQSVGWHGFV